uniref:Alkyl transferase n=1 Tax=Romanomermis culicivorax TaxID=13658 RepID=A0A915L0D4_ROMCU
MRSYFEQILKNFQKFCCKILKSGPLPKHVAFIMDGNRRYARQNALSSVLEGHTRGYSACYDMFYALTGTGNHSCINIDRGLAMRSYFEQILKNFQKFCCKILKSGPLPKHVAFIMDGNRRYARQNALSSVLEGHTRGYSALSATLEWCKELNITEVTIYAFSIENFKRTKAEVDGLFDMARQKLAQMKGDRSNISKNDLRFRFWGNLNLLPVDIQDSIRELVASTANNSRLDAVLEVMIPKI